MTTLRIGLALFLAAIGCSAPSEQPSSDPPTGQVTLQAAPSCDLHRANVAFTPPGCEDCMQQKCCLPTVACFSGNADCAALHACLVACPDDHSLTIPIGTEVDPKEQREEENPCAAACEQEHAPSVELRRAYDSCIRTQCMPVCAG